MNSKALPFLLIAGLVLAGAIVWNFFKTDETTEKVVQPETTVSQVEATPEKVVMPEKAEDIVIEDFDEPAVSYADTVTEEEIKASREIASQQMTFAMRYSTAEKALAGLRKLRESGNDEMANKLIDFIDTAYPNTSIPSELLD